MSRDMIKLRMTLAGGAVAFAMAIGTISVGTPALAYTNSISATGGTSRLIPADTSCEVAASAAHARGRTDEVLDDERFLVAWSCVTCGLIRTTEPS